MVIFINPGLTDNGFYDYDAGKMTLGATLARDEDLLFREYAHRALFVTNRTSSLSVANQAIESGLADYYACSFQNTPIWGKGLVSIMPLPPEYRERGYIRTMDNHKKFPDKSDPNRLDSEPHALGEVWSGAFWEIRSFIGKDRADKPLLITWSAFSEKSSGNYGEDFVKTLLDALKKSSLTPSIQATDPKASNQPNSDVQPGEITEIKKVFERRGMVF